jgi:hypothetical protein
MLEPFTCAQHQAAASASVKRRLQNCGEKLKNSTTAKALADVIELIEVAILDKKGATFARRTPDLDLQAQKIGQFLFEGLGVGVLVSGAPWGAARAFLSEGLDQRLNIADVQTVIDDLLG